MTESNSRPETKTTHHSASLGNLRNVLISSIREYQDIRDDKWIKITDTCSTDLILSTYGDTINRQILNCVSSNADTVMGIVYQCGIPQTTGYSKIIALVEYEFLVPYDTIQKKKSKQVHIYVQRIADRHSRKSNSHQSKTYRLFAKTRKNLNDFSFHHIYKKYSF